MMTGDEQRELIEYLVEQIVAYEVNEFSNSQKDTVEKIRQRAPFFLGGPYWRKEKYPL